MDFQDNLLVTKIQKTWHCSKLMKVWVITLCPTKQLSFGNDSDSQVVSGAKQFDVSDLTRKVCNGVSGSENGGG